LTHLKAKASSRVFTS
jgi:hypothetical protein